ncbi:MAG: hypothetical protein ACLQGV_01395 [Bryobacteraceae bacterium]
MAFYIVVRNRRNPEQPWQNVWADDNCIKQITTTLDIAKRCEDLAARNEVLLVHRTQWKAIPALISCECRVSTVTYGKGNARVQFKDCRPLNLRPPLTPERGQNCYEA